LSPAAGTLPPTHVEELEKLPDCVARIFAIYYNPVTLI
jgi:hypothetical protein